MARRNFASSSALRSLVRPWMSGMTTAGSYNFAAFGPISGSICAMRFAIVARSFPVTRCSSLTDIFADSGILLSDSCGLNCFSEFVAEKRVEMESERDHNRHSHDGFVRNFRRLDEDIFRDQFGRSLFTSPAQIAT